jgi:hypothetical protein
MLGRIDARTLKAHLHDGGEIALLDAREEVPFDVTASADGSVRPAQPP